MTVVESVERETQEERAEWQKPLRPSQILLTQDPLSRSLPAQRARFWKGLQTAWAALGQRVFLWRRLPCNGYV